MTISNRMADHLHGAAIQDEAQAIAALMIAGFAVADIMDHLDRAMFLAAERAETIARAHSDTRRAA